MWEKGGKRRKNTWSCPSDTAHQKSGLPNGQKYYGHKMQSTDRI